MVVSKSESSFRVGTGFDLHRLVAGRPFILGGVRIPFEKGPQGHSDGDVLLHAICDALLGAAGLDDLGSLFPDTDSRWKGASSSQFLEESLKRIKAAGFTPVNLDVVVLAEQPKISSHRAQIREALAAALGLPTSCVNLKGKTMEGLGPIGVGEAIAASATVLLRTS